MALEDGYITAVSLESYFVDKDTGVPLANGTVGFYRDSDRNTGKLVYQYNTNAIPNYQPLPNPITLSNTGNFVDEAGNNIAVYYYPYDAEGNLDLYYIRVYSALGQEQFTREAWPNLPPGTNPNLTQPALSNQITNPQFATLNFTNNPLVLSFTGNTTNNYPIAPDWILNVTHNGAGTVTVTQTAIAGNAQLPHNPPYTLTITPGANITAMSLTQRLPNDPAIWSPQAGGLNGWVASSILLAPASSLTVQYQPSVGTITTLLAANNVTGGYKEYTANVQLPASNNTDTGATGYVNINLILPTANPTTFSNVQVMGVESDLFNIQYEQTTVNRQTDQSFNYWSPLLQAKPIPSYLTGWDFALNPAQFLGWNIAAIASGANSSNYIWDQTMVFQTATSGFSYALASNGGLRVTCATAGAQHAIIQYLDAYTAVEILNNRLSVMISANTLNAPIVASASLYYTTGALPNIGANNSIVATLDANGHPATLHGAWTEVGRSLGNAITNIATAQNANFYQYGFNGWSVNGDVALENATYFAIVVGTGPMIHNASVDWGSISLVPGDVPTIPAPQKVDDVLRECQRYWWQTFLEGTVPAQNVGVNTGEFSFCCFGASPAPSSSNTILFPSYMAKAPTVTLYNPAAANAQIRDETANVDCSSSAASLTTQRGTTLVCIGNAASAIGHALGVHITTDARLGT